MATDTSQLFATLSFSESVEITSGCSADGHGWVRVGKLQMLSLHTPSLRRLASAAADAADKADAHATILPGVA